MASALPLAFHTLFTYLHVYSSICLVFVRKINSSSSSVTEANFKISVFGLKTPRNDMCSRVNDHSLSLQPHKSCIVSRK